MMMNRINGPIAASLLALCTSLVAGGCAAKVHQDVYDRDMAQVRSDLNSLDGRVSSNRQDITALSGRLDTLQAELEELSDEFDVTVARLEYGIRFATPVHFDYDRSDIRPEDQALLDRFAEVVSGHYDGALITVEGFADPAGSVAYNQALSERRARSVAEYLQSEGGLFPETMRTVGYGENRQVIPGAQGPGDAGIENRRVAFVIEYAPAAADETAPITAKADD
jgi:outer membrane protein OmpA-like peptidoglycan-associated protein